MEQALERRFGKQQEPDKVPDVLFIDGGLGQLRRAEEILARQLEFLGASIRCWWVSPRGDPQGGAGDPDPGESHEELHLPADMPALHLIQHIRDESHRFAITGHRARRAKARTTSTLEDIPGWGRNGGRRCSSTWAGCRR